MDIFVTPTFKAAHAARGGSPFAILTSSQQNALYRYFDTTVLSFRDHPGSIEHPVRTAAEVAELYSSVQYLISSLVCLFLYFTLIFFLFFMN